MNKSSTIKTALLCGCAMAVTLGGAAHAQIGVITMAQASAADSQRSGGVAGRVSDAQGEIYFEGARVEIEELQLRTSTDRSGSFRFSSVPPGTYTLSVDYLGADVVRQSITVASNQTAQVDVAIGEDVAAGDNILVVGKRASTLGALNRERNAENLVGVLDADAMGNFPDRNVAEAARRLSGVAVFNSFGEGNGLILRGLAFDFNRTTLNGLSLGANSPGGRSLGLTILAPELTSGLTLTKTTTPDMDHTGLGGSINIETYDPFDRNDLLLQAWGGVEYQATTEETSPEAGARFSNVFDLGSAGELGVSAVVSWNQRNYGAFPIGFGDGSGGAPGLGTGTQPYALFTNTDGSQAFVPTESLYFRRSSTRERLGTSANVAWKPNDDLKVSYNFLSTDFQEDFDDVFSLFSLTLSGAPFGDVITLATDTTGAFNSASEIKFGSLADRNNDLFFHTGSIEYFVGDWELEASIGHSSTRAETEAFDSLYFNTLLPDTSGTVSIADGRIMNFQYNDPGASTNGAGYELLEGSTFFNTSKDAELTYRFDIKRDVSIFEKNGYIKFGGYAREREQTGTSRGILGFGNDLITLDQFALDDAGFSDIYDAGVMPDAQALIAAQAANPGEFTFENFEDPDERFTEDIYAAYLMASIDLFPGFTVVGGARFEATEFSGASRETIIFQDIAGTELSRESTQTNVTNSYDNLFFSVNARYEVTDNVIARAAFTQTLQRPSFDSLAGPRTFFFSVPVGADPEEANVVRRSFSGGNPELEPLRSDNYDISLAWYPDQNSVVSIGYFYKDLSNFETDFVDSSLDGMLALDIPGVGPVTGFNDVSFPVAGRSGHIQGFEVNLAKNFTELPAPWDGLVATANFTKVDSELELDVDGQRIEGRLPFQVDTMFNISVGYEKEGFSSRLSWSQIGESVEQFNLRDSGDRISDGLRSLDLSVRYSITERIGIDFEATNLTNEPEFFFIGEPSRPWAFEEFGRAFALKLNYSFF